MTRRTLPGAGSTARRTLPAGGSTARRTPPAPGRLSRGPVTSSGGVPTARRVATLAPWQPSDAEALVAAVAESPDLVLQLGGGAVPSVDAARELIESQLVQSADPTWAFAVRVDGRAVGHVALAHVEHRHATAWVSYWLTASERGRGLATRAVASVARFAFDDLGLFRLELGHRVNNPASCRVATGAGFAAEGVERAKLRYGDERFDVETHARLASDPDPGVALLTLNAG
ncbi:hypothetical protein CTKZ_19290 [Cellulomonas algicola]|uniref:N-acetyltransferase domain-containing protein n=1 Tax=Cellulomonas algicola TaxID=2071633 RepID=A0A401V095_9CELL|nr:GNAT family protein [Cellulomonas algicola]GCD20367.1 hypothetical protein CTKZ_19290 [Cellulomonas algicola]